MYLVVFNAYIRLFYEVTDFKLAFKSYETFMSCYIFPLYILNLR